MAELDPRSELDRLITWRISQASIAPRAGRAGRLSPGVCLHLFRQDQGERAPEHHAPEITYTDLAPFWLELLQWGVSESAQLSWLDAPPALAAVVETLAGLGALDSRQHLTPAGRAWPATATTAIRAWGRCCNHAAATPMDATGSPAAPDDALSAQEWLIAPGLLQLSQSLDAHIRLALPLDINRLAAARPAWFSHITAHVLGSG